MRITGFGFALAMILIAALAARFSAKIHASPAPASPPAVAPR
jgi:hypothetical protein